MKILFRTLLIILGSGLLINIVQAKQLPDKNDTTIRSDQEQGRINQQRQSDALARQDRILNSQPKIDVMPPKRRISKDKSEELNEWGKEHKLTEAKLLPPQKYWDQYGDFLKSKKAGLARLFIDKGCDQGKTVTVQELERCAGVVPVKGDGSFYSFIFRANEAGGSFWWDIHFDKDKFVVGNDRIQSIIAELGDIDLEDARKSKALKFLDKFEMKKTLAEIKEQRSILEKGIENDGFTYSNNVPVKINQTYILRTVAYLHPEIPAYYHWETGFDLTIAFKVVAREADGSLILLWKELKSEQPRHKLK